MTDNKANNNNKNQQPEQKEETAVLHKPPKQAPTGASSPKGTAVKKEAAPPVVIKDKTGIGARLDEAMKSAKPANRSSDLVPLSREYEVMRKELKTLINVSKNYHGAMLEIQKARMNLVMQFSSLSTNTPIFDAVGNTVGKKDDPPSFAAVAQEASKAANDFAKDYKEQVWDSAIEWERVVTTRVDFEITATGKLHERLNHYQDKVTALRKKVKAMDVKGKNPSKGLQEKLDRNEKKLDQAWKAHERSASKLCNLIEEVTTHGWKDLRPLVKATMQWEIKRASEEYDVMAQLPVVEEFLDEAYEKNKSESKRKAVPVVMMEEEPSAPAATTTAVVVDNESETTGSFHPDEEIGSSFDSETAEGGYYDDDEEEEEVTYEVPVSPKPNSKRNGGKAPHSPKDVMQHI